MASWMCLSVCIVATIVLHQVSGTTLTLPSQITIGGANPTTSLDGTCTPPTGTTTVYTITISRRRITGGQDTPMVQIAQGESNNAAEIKDGGLRSRLTVQGNLQPGNLQFSLSDPTCDDVKDYTFVCTTMFLPISAGNTEDSKNVTYTVNPDNVRMVPFPDRTVYDANELVTFTCTGLVGTNVPEDQSNFWIWEARDVSGMFPGTWFRYNTNITYSTPTTAPSPNSCNFNGRSVFTHTVTELDNDKEFRCSILRNEAYSANKTIRLNDPTTPGGTGQVGGGEPENANVGMIVGIVIGVLVAIVLVVVLVYFLVFRRKSGGGDDYDTGEGKENGPQMADNVVYTTPTSKAHRGKGRENDGLDEPHEKNPRPYYANDFGDRDQPRGRSNPAMDNDSRHDRSFDDDNTDSRMRSPYGSAV